MAGEDVESWMRESDAGIYLSDGAGKVCAIVNACLAVLLRCWGRKIRQTAEEDIFIQKRPSLMVIQKRRTCTSRVFDHSRLPTWVFI